MRTYERPKLVTSATISFFFAYLKLVKSNGVKRNCHKACEMTQTLAKPVPSLQRHGILSSIKPFVGINYIYVCPPVV